MLPRAKALGARLSMPGTATNDGGGARCGASWSSRKDLGGLGGSAAGRLPGHSLAIVIGNTRKQGPTHVQVDPAAHATSVSQRINTQSPAQLSNSTVYKSQITTATNDRVANVMSNPVEENKPDLKVDETPISPLERRNSLEKHLQYRPEAQDLKNRGILYDSNAAP